MNFFYRLGFCIFIAAAVALLFPRTRYHYLVVHHTASDSGNLSTVRRGHWARGWFDAGYHLILNNGSTAVPAGDLQASLRYRFATHSVATRSKRHNVLGLHLSVVGNYDKQAPSAEMWANLAHAVRTLHRQYGIPRENILLHRDCSATACPGRFIQRDQLLQWMDRDADTIDPAVATRQKAVLGKTLTAPAFLFTLMLLGQLGVWAWWRYRRRRNNRPITFEAPPS